MVDVILARMFAYAFAGRDITGKSVEEQEAVKMMADTDKRRMTNYNFYTEQKWGKLYLDGNMQMWVDAEDSLEI